MTERKDCLLGVDLGAGSLKATLIAPDGTLLGEAAQPIETASPRLGWAEQDPESWYAALCQAVPAALAAAGVAPTQLAALSISAGAHIAVLLDARNRVIRPAILWSDQRSQAEAQELHAEAGDLIIERSLNRVNPTWTLAQLRWLQRHEPESIAKVARLFVAKDFLRYRVTGDWHTDFSDVIGALMADGRTRGWSPEICALIDWPMESLPPVVEPIDVVGEVSPEAASASGLPAGLPVVCGSNDTTVELYGVGALGAGQGAIKLATAGVVYLTTEQAKVHPPISCYPHIMPGRYYTATGINSCASAHRWLRDGFFTPLEGGKVDAGGSGRALFETMDRMAGTVPPGAEGLIFHPYLQGERAPHWDPQLRADFIGLTMRHDRRHLVRALYEGVAFALRDCLDSGRAEGLDFAEIRLIGGGARSALWRQIIADVMDMEILLPGNGDASFGAALVAGAGVGLFASPQEAVERCVRIVDRTRPDPERCGFYAKLLQIYREAQACLAPLDHRLHALCLGEAGG